MNRLRNHEVVIQRLLLNSTLGLKMGHVTTLDSSDARDSDGDWMTGWVWTRTLDLNRRIVLHTSHARGAK